MTYPPIIITYFVNLRVRFLNTNFMVKLNNSNFTIFKKLAELVTFKNVLDFKNCFFGNDVFKILLKDGGGDSYCNLTLLVEYS